MGEGRLVRIRRLVVAMLVALVLGPAWAIGPLAPPPAYGAAPLPACRYDDVETAFTSTDDWQRTLVDTTFMVGRSYVPPDLVPVTDAGISGNGSVRSLVIPDLRAMAAAAKAAGSPIAVQSSYRSYATQVYTFNYWTRQYGEAAALLGSARPGHSEHQLGVALDFRSAGTSPEWVGDWATSPAGGWMKKNAWRFGFVMSYPAGASPDLTCYRYESWHYRYVGREEATAIHDAGTTIRQYLWSELGNDVMTGPSKGQSASPAPAASSSATRPRTPRPTASATPTTSPSPAPSTATGSASPATTPEAAAPTPGPSGGVAGTTGRPPGRGGSPLGLLLHALGIMLGIVVGLGILVAAEQLTRALHRWMRGLRLA